MPSAMQVMRKISLQRSCTEYQFRHCFQAASRRPHSFFLINDLFFLGEYAHFVLNGVDAPTHNCQHNEQADHDDRDDNVWSRHDAGKVCGL